MKEKHPSLSLKRYERRFATLKPLLQAILFRLLSVLDVLVALLYQKLRSMIGTF